MMFDPLKNFSSHLFSLKQSSPQSQSVNTQEKNHHLTLEEWFASAMNYDQFKENVSSGSLKHLSRSDVQFLVSFAVKMDIFHEAIRRNDLFLINELMDGDANINFLDNTNNWVDGYDKEFNSYNNDKILWILIKKIQ